MMNIVVASSLVLDGERTVYRKPGWDVYTDFSYALQTYIYKLHLKI